MKEHLNNNEATTGVGSDDQTNGRRQQRLHFLAQADTKLEPGADIAIPDTKKLALTLSEPTGVLGGSGGAHLSHSCEPKSAGGSDIPSFR